MMTKIDVALSGVAEKESLKEEKTFSIAGSNFFSLSPEHLGRTSANELDEIIAKEALGGRWRTSITIAFPSGCSSRTPWEIVGRLKYTGER